MGFNTDNFDKEFSLNQNRKKTSARGKLPSWLMILAGVAVIGGVVAARQPALRQTDTGTRTTVSMPAGQMVSGENLIYNAVNDEKVNPSELEARFLSQGDQALSQNTEPAEVIEPTPTAAENMLVLAPEQPAPADTVSETSEQTVSTDTENKTTEQIVATDTENKTAEQTVEAIKQNRQRRRQEEIYLLLQQMTLPKRILPLPGWMTKLTLSASNRLMRCRRLPRNISQIPSASP